METRRKSGVLPNLKMQWCSWCVVVGVAVLSFCVGAETATTVGGELLEPSLGSVVSLDQSTPDDADADPAPSDSPTPAATPRDAPAEDTGTPPPPSPDPGPRNASETVADARPPRKVAKAALPVGLRLLFAFLYYALPTVNMFLLNPSLARTILPIFEYFFGEGVGELFGSSRTLKLVVSTVY
ncbi:uncharacterized protein LOC125039184 [Penaeus chinensis]|uniref:uncharacterized protein LOC125039184 n=1 Tax=Penaeus chinensis TaxID=139456 RepID=UPI001FB5C840|nr:uncharacterized protein LOC125039184 [Penaeus chinensis]